MCGLAGLTNLRGLPGDQAGRLVHLRAMGSQLARRGPDDEQFYDDGKLSLVFRRLAIVDVKGGRQPLWYEDHTVMATVNGEIYNYPELRLRLAGRHQFATRSDSEAIVHLYEEFGSGLMQQLIGMFAFLVWDTREQVLLLARDRLGIKPLFYTWAGDSLLFASEIKALLAHPDCPRRLNWNDIAISSGSAEALTTYVHDVHQLPGGHFIRLAEGGDTRPRPYWLIRDHFSAPGCTSLKSVADWSEEYGELLADSIKRRLMSDVPVGLFLSGGIDSSLLAGQVAMETSDLNCFTVVEDSTIDAGDVEQAKKVTSELGLPYHPVRFDSLTVLDELNFGLEEFEFVIWALESPKFRVEWFIKLELHRYARTRVPNLKAMLLGQGADEFAGGYSRSMGNENTSWQDYLQELSLLHEQARRIDSAIPRYMWPALLPGQPRSPETDGLPEFHQQMMLRISLLQRYNLWHEDRTSASQGVEARGPFLDHRLVELLASIPVDQHPSLFFDKRIVRDHLRRILPGYPEDRLKVKFYSAGRGNSINRLKQSIAKRVYPDFRDRYLGKSGSLFQRDRLDGFYRLLQSGKPVKPPDVTDFIDVMAIEVFTRLCLGAESAGPPPGVSPPSSLREWVQ